MGSEPSGRFPRLHEDVPVAERTAGWRIAADGSRFTRPDGGGVDIDRRPVLRRLLAKLVAHHLEAPGSVASRDDLVKVAWPDERILPRAAVNRLNVSIATLRNLGLRDILQTCGGGYRLDPSAPIIPTATSLSRLPRELRRGR